MGEGLIMREGLHMREGLRKREGLKNLQGSLMKTSQAMQMTSSQHSSRFMIKITFICSASTQIL